MDMTEIIAKFQEHEERIAKLESKARPASAEDAASVSNPTDFKGLSGGINMLMKNKFLATLKSAQQIKEELRREGYVYEIAPISKVLSIDFVRKKKVLNRIREDGIWKYCMRK